MNIAIIAGSFLPTIGGLEWKVHYLATEYIRRGHSATVFAQRPHFSQRKNKMPVTYDYDLVYCNYPFPGWGYLGISQAVFFRAVTKRHCQTRYDIIHCHNLARPTEYGVLIKKATNLPVVATPCGYDIQIVPELRYGARLSRRYDRLIRNNLQQVDVVGCISSSVREDILSLKPRASLIDIPNGVDWSVFNSCQTRRLREKLSLTSDDLLIVSIGRNHPKKGYRLGIEAFAGIASQSTKIHYAIIGHGTTTLTRLVSEFQLADRVSLIEQIPMNEVPDAMRSADIFFNPSLVEGFAQVNAQALACGLPCVLTDAPGNRDAGDFGGALIAKSGDTASMASALSTLASNPVLRAKLANESRISGRRYAWSRIAEDYLGVFEKLARKEVHQRSTERAC